MKRLMFVVFLCLFIPLPVLAQENEMRRFDINFNFIGYARQSDQSYAAGKLSFAYHPTPHWALVADAGIHVAGDTNTLSQDLTTYRFGPRYSVTHGRRLTYFTQFLAGGARVTNTLSLSSPSSTTTTTTSSHVDGFSFAAGGGFDVALRPWFAFRAAEVEYSFLRIGSPSKNSNGVKVSGGIVFRFGK